MLTRLGSRSTPEMSTKKRVVSALELIERLEAEPILSTALQTPRRLTCESRTTSRPSVSDWLKSASPSLVSDTAETPIPVSYASPQTPELRVGKENGRHGSVHVTPSTPNHDENDDDNDHNSDEEQNDDVDDQFDWTKGDLWPKLTRTPFISKEEPLVLSSSPEVVVPAHIGVTAWKLSNCQYDIPCRGFFNFI